MVWYILIAFIFKASDAHFKLNGIVNSLVWIPDFVEQVSNSRVNVYIFYSSPIKHDRAAFT
jgi:hypothetical protein